MPWVTGSRCGCTGPLDSTTLAPRRRVRAHVARASCTCTCTCTAKASSSARPPGATHCVGVWPTSWVTDTARSLRTSTTACRPSTPTRSPCRPLRRPKWLAAQPDVDPTRIAVIVESAGVGLPHPSPYSGATAASSRWPGKCRRIRCRMTARPCSAPEPPTSSTPKMWNRRGASSRRACCARRTSSPSASYGFDAAEPQAAVSRNFVAHQVEALRGMLAVRSATAVVSSRPVPRGRVPRSCAPPATRLSARRR